MTPKQVEREPESQPGESSPKSRKLAFVAAVMLYVALADAAVETWWSGSPVRWWTTAVVTIYFLTSISLRGTTWKAKAVLTFLFLLTIAALTAWLPGGTSHGLRLLNQPTPRVLSAVAAFGVALAGLVLWRIHRLPGTLRLGLVGLAVYGVAAFVHGMFAGVRFSTLLQGGSLWQFLPLVLQGTIVGGLVILPTALLASIVRGRVFRPGFRKQAGYQIIALATSLAVVVSGISQQAPTLVIEPNPPDPKASSDDRIVSLQNSFRALEDGEREAPRDRWDPEYVVKALGGGPQVLFKWARDNTSWIPYRGALRGATGVLMDRQGNSLDRALLLATLLQKAGHSVRLAHSELTRERALQMLPGLTTHDALIFSDPTEIEVGAAPGIQTLAAKYQLDGAAIERTLVSQTEAIKRVVSEFDTTVADQTQRLLQAVDQPNPSEEWNTRLEQAVASLRDHWWVQQRDVDESWIDLDVMNPAGTIGSALSSAAETLSMESLPLEVHHQIVIRVIAEQWSNGALHETRVLEHVLRPSQLFGQPVVLQFWPGSWPAQIHPDPTSPFGFRRIVLEQRNWAAALLVGRQVAAEGAIRESVRARNPSAGNPWGELGNSIGALSQRSGSLPGDQVLTATWIEYETRIPGQTLRPVRRVVFDLIGPAARSADSIARPLLDESQRLTRSLSLMMRTEILPVACSLAPEFVTHLTAQNLLANRDLIEVLVSGQFSTGSDESEKLLRNAVRPVSSLAWLALARLEWSRFGNQIFIDGPNILTRHSYLRAAENGLALVDAMDIVRNEIGVTLDQPDAFHTRLEQGVLDTNAEALLAPGGSLVGNTGRAFEASQDWVTLVAEDKESIDAVKLPADARTRIAQDLEEGFVAVAPKYPVRIGQGSFLGWWRIDPVTGTALGVGENGWGTSSSEYGSTLRSVLIFAAEGFVFENGLCHAIPQVANDLRFLGHVIYPYWHPSWTRQAQYEDPMEVYKANARTCLIQAMVMGFLATLPLLLITLKSSTITSSARGVNTLPSPYAPPGTSPKPKGNPGPHGSGGGKPSPGGTLPGGAKPPADPFGKTEPGVAAASSGPQAGQAGAPPFPRTRQEAQEALRDAYNKFKARQAESGEAAGDYVRYRAQNPPGSPTYDPLVDQDHWDRWAVKHQQTTDAILDWRRANRNLRDHEDAAAAIERVRAGHEGWQPAPQRPGFPGCPPNCGNENPTGPAGAVQAPAPNKTLIGLGGIIGSGS